MGWMDGSGLLFELMVTLVGRTRKLLLVIISGCVNKMNEFIPSHKINQQQLIVCQLFVGRIKLGGKMQLECHRATHIDRYTPDDKTTS